MRHAREGFGTWALLAALLAGPFVTSVRVEPQPARVYFGSLGAYPFTTGRTGGSRSDFEAARTVDGMDYLALASRTSTLQLRKDASSLNSVHDGRFVAMWSWQYGTPAKGNYVNVLELRNLDEGTVPHGRYDVFFRTWLRLQDDVTAHVPIVQLPQPRELALDYGLSELEFPAVLADTAGPYVRTVEIVRDQSSAPGRPGRVTGDWAPYLNYLNIGFRIAPTADVERSARIGPTASERRTAIVAARLSKESLLEGIRERRVYSTEDRNLNVGFSINGHSMGSVVSMDPGTPLRIEVTLHDPDEPRARYWLSLRRDAVGGAIDASREFYGTDLVGDGRVVFTQFTRRHHDEYLLFQILQEGPRGSDTVWTAPIWLTTSPAP